MYKKTFRTNTLKLAATLSLGLILTACGGGGGGSQLDNAIGSSRSNSSSSSIDTSEVQAIGRGSGANFVPGEIGTSLGDSSLSAGGTTVLSVNAVSGTGNLVTDAIAITFNSPCIARGEAELTTLGGETLTDQTITTTNGEASVIYRAKGCVGDDDVIATANYRGNIFTARTSVNVEADLVGSIQFVGAIPDLISLKGTGGQETSEITFNVRGGTNAPIKNVDVTFALTPADADGEGIGGLKLIYASGKTDTSGNVTAIVQAGRIPTSIRVRATVVDTNISTLSSQLVISTGIPDQKSMSIAVDNHRPAAWNYNNVEVAVTVNLADAFNNPAPDGTAVYFTTEGGSIESPCFTGPDVPGSCSATWRSQEPRPGKSDSDYSIDRILCRGLSGAAEYECITGRAGRVTILATALGNESFIDTNGNGVYDYGIDVFAKAEDDSNNNPVSGGGNCHVNVPVSSASLPPGSPLLACDDLAEVYIDKNESGIRDSSEGFTDIATKNRPKNGTHDGADGKYNGVLCVPPDDSGYTQAAWEEINHCTNDAINIRQDAVIIMACSKPLLSPQTGKLPDQPESVTLMPGRDGDSSAVPPIAEIPPESKVIEAFLADCNGNSMPEGTEIEVVTTDLNNATATVSTSGYFPGQSGQRVLVTLSADGTDTPTGSFSLQITTGDNITTTSPTRVN